MEFSSSSFLALPTGAIGMASTPGATGSGFRGRMESRSPDSGTPHFPCPKPKWNAKGIEALLLVSVNKIALANPQPAATVAPRSQLGSMPDFTTVSPMAENISLPLSSPRQETPKPDAWPWPDAVSPSRNNTGKFSLVPRPTPILVWTRKWWLSAVPGTTRKLKIFLNC